MQRRGSLPALRWTVQGEDLHLVKRYSSPHPHVYIGEVPEQSEHLRVNFCYLLLVQHLCSGLLQLSCLLLLLR